MSYLVIPPQRELKLDRLLQSFEPPITFLFFKRRHSQELFNGLFWCLGLHLFGIVVFVLHVYVSSLLGIVVILVLEVVAVTR